MKKRTTGESLEPAPLVSRLPQLNILGGKKKDSDDASSSSGSGSPSQAPAKKAAPKIVEIVEIGEDGAFDIPDTLPPPAAGADGDGGGDGDDGDDDDDEPPELDLSNLLGQDSGAAATPPSAPTAASAPAEGPTLADEMQSAALAARQKVKDKAVAEEARVKKEFGSGMKGGFFNQPKKKAGPAAAAKKKKPSTIETLRPAQPGAREGGKSGGAAAPVIAEVQEAMKGVTGGPMSAAMADGKWMTPSLMQKFVTNPKLARGMVDPRFQAALQELQKDPAAAMAKHQGDKELTAFLTEFCTTMGEHFTHLGEVQAKEKAVAGAKAAAAAAAQEKAQEKARVDAALKDRPLSAAAVKRAEAAAKKATKAGGGPGGGPGGLLAADPEEQKRVDEVLRNDEVRELLMDSELQRVLQSCQEPGRLGAVMRDPKWGPKIRKLADFGLVRIER